MEQHFPLNSKTKSAEQVNTQSLPYYWDVEIIWLSAMWFPVASNSLEIPVHISD